MKNKISVISVLVVVLGLFAFAAYQYQKKQNQQQQKIITQGEASLVRDHSPSIGTPLARVTLVEFLDPECESCRMFHPVVKQLLKKYDGNIHFVIRYAPFHRNSKKAVAFLEAARMQGKYWETLDLLFEKQPEWADHHQPKPDLVWTYIDQLGLDEAKMREDVKSAAIQEMIEIDIKDGRGLNIRGTPTFFVNGRQPARFGAEYLDQAIQEALQ